MRCKKHITDGSSRVGVCASCLRERLFVLVEAQARSEAAVLSLQQQIDHEDHRKSDPINNYHSTQPPPLIFPRSVSPYICRHRSNIVEHQNQNSRFYSTPQLGHTNPSDTANTNTSSSSSSATHKKKNRFRFLSNLFRSSNRSVVVIDEQQQQPEPQIPDPPSTISRSSLSTSSPIPSSTWYSSLIPNRHKTTQESPCRSTTNHHHHRPRHHHRNKGLSPNYTEEEEEDNVGGGGEYINNIGYVSESSPGWRKSYTTTPGRQRRGGQNGNNSKNVSMAFCLSPLVRASPKRRNQKDGGGGGLQTGFSGEIRVSSSVHNHNHHNPNLSTAASFCANRSRKIANFGRYNN